jgi:RimJ/RimL family protein N-acetyltransferase
MAWDELDGGDGFVLRRPREDEAKEALALLRDPEVDRWNPQHDVTNEHAAAEWCRKGADWSAGDHATFSVVELATGRLAGNVSLHRIDPDHDSADIGYRIARWARNQGRASLAVAAVTDWAFATLGLYRVQLQHAVANAASCKVAANAGFRLEGTLRRASRIGPAPTDRGDDHLHARLATD